jgi:hypothetical protein
MIEPEEFADGGTDVLDEQPDHISVGVTDEDAERTP